MTPTERRPYREFGSWLRARRLARRWTQEELATRLSYDVTYVRKIEWGERKATEGFRARLAEVFELPVESLPDPEAGTAAPKVLPTPATSFVGRSGDVEAVVGLLLSRARLVTLLGAPGIGKTRLAIEVAAGLDERLPHGSWFVPLVTVVDPATVPVAICDALGLRTTGPEAAEKLLVDHLRQHELLLVLDNFEHVVPAAPLVAHLLAGAPALRVLATSREALRVTGETEYSVPPLPIAPAGTEPRSERSARSPAVTLFVDRARLAQPSFTVGDEDVDAVVGICERLDGVPLAIELAAAAARLLSLQALLDALDYVLDLPTRGPQDAPAHQQTLRTTIDWSYQLLEEEHRTLMARLGIFVGGFTLDGVAAVCRGGGVDRPAVVAGVAALVTKSLLETRPDAPGGSRILMLEAIREYALERLNERHEIDDLGQRHAAWYVELAERAERQLTGKEQARWLDVLGAEHANLRAALSWAVLHRPPEALRLAGALWRFWWMRGHVSEGRRWFEDVLGRARGDDRCRVRAAVGAGVLAGTQGDYGPAEKLLEEAAALAESSGADEELALALVSLGVVQENQGRYETATALFDRSLSIYRKVGSQRGIGHALNCLGNAAVYRGDNASAREFFDQALAAFHAVEDQWSIALACANLGWVAYASGDTKLARSWYSHSLSLCRTVGDQRGIANALSNMGRVAFKEGDLPAATGFIEEALLLVRRIGERRAVAECLEELAAVAAADGELLRAARLYAAAAMLRETLGAPLWPTEAQAQQEVLEGVRAGLSAHQLEEAWAEGRRMTTDEAVSLALARTHSAADHPV
jgi:predicted ATPase/Tfp pilus assembly protein PilF